MGKVSSSGESHETDIFPQNFAQNLGYFAITRIFRESQNHSKTNNGKDGQDEEVVGGREEKLRRITLLLIC